MPGLTVAHGQSLAEQAAVCFDHCGHGKGVILNVKGWKDCTYCLICPEVTDQVRRTHNDLQVATEHGAYAVAICTVSDLTGFLIVLRSRKGSGFDYWIGRNHDSDGVCLKGKARLEVSGTLRGPTDEVERRLREKCKQTERSDSTGLPAFVVVVQFDEPLAKVVKR